MWLCTALAGGILAFRWHPVLHTGTIDAFQFAPAALMAPLRLVPNPKLRATATSGCRAVRRRTMKPVCSVTESGARSVSCPCGGCGGRHQDDVPLDCRQRKRACKCVSRVLSCDLGSGYV